jgi:hypothetical protein
MRDEKSVEAGGKIGGGGVISRGGPIEWRSQYGDPAKLPWEMPHRQA